uniref:G-protein coupled receptors family 1 profile domain-containing protein n=1 Tax=Eutreptiella gymnastica TaxID=73025 RepID=A0A7S1J9V6_9EUGL
MVPKMLSLLLLALLVAPCEANVFTNGLVYLPIYLGIATIANIYFTYRAFKAFQAGYVAEAAGMVILMLSGVAWCVPCFIQCIGTAIQGEFWGWGGSETVGCDVMGYYSAFATYSSQMATVLMAFITYALVFTTVPRWTLVVAAGVALFVVAAVVALLPLVGVGEYVKYEGFCYIDYRNVPQCILWLVIMVPCVLAVLGMYVTVYRKDRIMTQPLVRKGLLGLWFVFFCGWVLGVPLIVIGLANCNFPSGLNLTSAILGHGMNLVNPILYGWLWYNWFIRDRSMGAYPAMFAYPMDLLGQGMDYPVWDPTSKLPYTHPTPTYNPAFGPQA